jgi:benzoyl-CoA-dihydrodiol lyase
VLPGTGGLTRVVDKRKVRRDLADFFGTTAEGVKGRRAVEWRLVDAVHPTVDSRKKVAERALELAPRPIDRRPSPGIALGPLNPSISDDSLTYSAVHIELDRAKRVATLTVAGPAGPQPSSVTEIVAAGDQFWPLRAFRELDDALLRLRFNEPSIGTIVLKTRGVAGDVLAVDATLSRTRPLARARDRPSHQADPEAHRSDVAQLLRAHRAGQLFAGTLFELALAADRSYMLDDRTAEHHRAVADERRPAEDEQRPDAARDAVSWRRRTGRRAPAEHEPFDARRRSMPGWSRSRPTSSTGTTRCGWRSKAARRCRPTR